MTFEDLERAVLVHSSTVHNSTDDGSYRAGRETPVSDFRRHSLRLLFDLLDEDCSGLVGYDEFLNVLHVTQSPDAVLEVLALYIDRDGSSTISRDEFLFQVRSSSDYRRIPAVPNPLSHFEHDRLTPCFLAPSTPRIEAEANISIVFSHRRHTIRHKIRGGEAANGSG